MTAAGQTKPAEVRRRVGTFTLGVVLVAAGTAMMVSLFWPRLHLAWLLKCSPLILIALGVETLLAARGGGRVKYDWLGMLLCFLLTGAALCLYAAAWWFTGGEAGGVRARYTGLDLYQMQYTLFTGADSHTLSLKAGEAIRGRVDTYIGELEVEVSDGDGNTICEEFPMNGERLIEVPAAGEYTILVYGRRTSGSFSFTRVPAEEAPAEKTTPIPAEVPEGAA